MVFTLPAISTMNNGTLYLVGTPIGNLEDITLRALRILEEVDLIACEDKRQTLKLLNHFKIKKELRAYHKYNEREEAEKLIEILKSGKDIALVSDAGLPIISDPGQYLVSRIREEEIPVTVVPGANAALTGLMLSGIDSRAFTFFGFPPKTKKEQKIYYDKIMDSPETSVLYESPHHLKETLKELSARDKSRTISVSRELTKLHEETVTMSLEEAKDYFTNPRGEFVLVIEGKTEEPVTYTEEDILKLVEDEVAGGLSEKEAIKKVSKERGLKRRDVYELVKIKSNV